MNENKTPLYVDVKTIKRFVMLLGIPLKVGRLEIVQIRMVGRLYCFLDSDFETISQILQGYFMAT